MLYPKPEYYGMTVTEKVMTWNDKSGRGKNQTVGLKERNDNGLDSAKQGVGGGQYEKISFYWNRSSHRVTTTFQTFGASKRAGNDVE